MASFDKGAAVKTPFGKNVYLRSSKGLKFESYTFAAATLPAQTIDGVPNQKILQPGTVLAKITVGPDTGKVGVFQAAGTSEVQTLTPTTVTAGTFTLAFNGQTTAPIAFNATNPQIQAALEALNNIAPGDIVVAGGPLTAAAVTVTFFGNLIGDVAQLVVNNAGLTGTIAVTTTTPGVAGAADGRQTLANIVGLNDTFLPWQLMEHDAEVGAVYDATAVQAWCFEYSAVGLPVTLTNTTADAMRSVRGMDVTFH